MLSDVLNTKKIKLDKNDSEEYILGGIMLNRIVGIAYDNLDFSEFNKESKRVLSIMKNYYDEQYDIFLQKLKYVASIFKDVYFPYAFLKGAFITPALYKKGQRISNDIDILIEAKDATKAHEFLIQNGFVQGHCANDGAIVPATRREIILAKMNYGETVPYLCYYNGNLLEIDLNFSMDFKAKGTQNVVSELLERRQQMIVADDISIITLAEADFLIHLCCHLYKEATTYDWLIHRRDLMLYKFSDINVFLHTYGCSGFFDQLEERIARLSVEKECFYAFFNSSIIYPHINEISGFQLLLENIMPASTEYLRYIYYPSAKTVYSHELSFEAWFASKDRISELNMISQREGMI